MISPPKKDNVFRALDRKLGAVAEFTMRQYRTKLSTWVVMGVGFVAIAIIVLFYVDWCPHCVSTKPEWETLVNNMNNKNVNGTNVKVQACNAEGSAVEKEFANENNVQGYPTIKLIKENDVVEYNGARNVNALEEFIKENAN